MSGLHRVAHRACVMLFAACVLSVAGAGLAAPATPEGTQTQHRGAEGHGLASTPAGMTHGEHQTEQRQVAPDGHDANAAEGHTGAHGVGPAAVSSSHPASDTRASATGGSSGGDSAHATHDTAPAAGAAANATAGHGHDAAEAPHVHPASPDGEPSSLLQRAKQDGTPVAGVDEKLGTIIPEGIMLRDEAGNLVDARSLMTVPTLVAPVYYSCPTVCNMLQSSIARVLPALNMKAGTEYRVLSVSFDELDTAELASHKKKNYLAAVGGDYPPDGWRFLTADLPNVQRFMDAIGFRFTRQGRDFVHPVVLVAVSPEGRITRYLYGNGFLPFDVTMALHEAAEEKVGLSLRRAVSYCFTYDPKGRKYVFDVMKVAGVVILFGAGVLLFVLLRGGRRRN